MYFGISGLSYGAQELGRRLSEIRDQEEVTEKVSIFANCG